MENCWKIIEKDQILVSVESWIGRIVLRFKPMSLRYETFEIMRGCLPSDSYPRGLGGMYNYENGEAYLVLFEKGLDIIKSRFPVKVVESGERNGFYF